MKIKFLYIDLFCGFGGTSKGVHMAMRNKDLLAEVVACINHDPGAILCHLLNFPNCYHATEDIRTAALGPILKLLLERKEYWGYKGYKVYVVIWASAECTNLSNAKGGMSRNADSRTLAEHLDRYIEALNPDFIQIENVKEFLLNGPLEPKVLESNIKKEIYYPHCPLEITKSKNKKISFGPVWVPIKSRQGEYYHRWVKNMTAYNYQYAYKIINSADHGEHTSRSRYFGMFARPHLPLTFPNATHTKNTEKNPSLKKWNPVKYCLNFSNEGESIFIRNKEYAEKTLERILAGLIKYVAGGKEAFLTKMHSSHNNTKVSSGADIDSPAPTITTFAGNNLVQPKFLMKYYSGGGQLSSINSPCSTLPTKDRVAIVDAQYWIDKQYSGSENHQSIEVPAGVVMTNDKNVIVKAWVMNTDYNNIGSSLEDPAHTITASRRHKYLMNPQYNNKGGDVNQPCFTLIARMDKMPPYLVSTEDGYAAIAIFETDSKTMIEIKKFMALYGIIDIKMRMLEILELMKIQGLDENYKLSGNKTEQKKWIGNMVTPRVVKHWIEDLELSLQEYHSLIAA